MSHENSFGVFKVLSIFFSLQCHPCILGGNLHPNISFDRLDCSIEVCATKLIVKGGGLSAKAKE